jgi:voltage-gated potassium channel
MAEREPMSTEPRARWREQLRVIIFEADTPLGKLFDVGLLVTIVLSIIAVMLESVEVIADRHGQFFRRLEWAFTFSFTVEYTLRLICVPKPIRYARSFFGIVDLLAVLPTYMSLLVPGSQSLIVIRALRLLRVFRIFKLARFLGEASVLREALESSRHKILVFLITVIVLVVILGSAMFVIEGAEHGFTSIPRSMYWAIVTMTTVGYGDITPQTVPGQVLAAMVMIIGYGIIAIPTGIVTAEIVRHQPLVTTRCCPACMTEGHLHSARFCRDCGAELAEPDPPIPTPTSTPIPTPIPTPKPMK